VTTPVGTPWPIRSDGSKDVVIRVVLELKDTVVALLCAAIKLEVDVWPDADTVDLVVGMLVEPVADADVGKPLLVDVEEPANVGDTGIEPVPVSVLKGLVVEDDATIIGVLSEELVAENKAVVLGEAVGVGC
jgi:hypothetical protein